MNTPLKDLTIKNNFMFAAVMSDEENCKGFLERALPIKIEHVEISTEKISFIILNIKVYDWMCMRKMKRIPVII